MPAVADIVLADALATPVNHTFKPLGPDANGVWYFEDSTSVNALGNWQLSVQLVRPGLARAGDNSAKRLCRIKLGIHTPVLENVTNSTVTGVSPAPTLSYVPRCNIEFVFPERSVKDYDRKTQRKLAYNLLQNAQIASVIEDLQNYY